MDTGRSPGRFMLHPVPSVQTLNFTPRGNGAISPSSYSFADEINNFTPGLQESEILQGDKSSSERHDSSLRRTPRGFSGSRKGGRSKGQRTKVSRACDACKQKRTRCSGDQPCVRCRHLHISCDYFAIYTRGRLPAVPTASVAAQSEVHLSPQDGLNNVTSMPNQGPVISTQPRQHVDKSDEHSNSGHAAPISSRNSPVPSTNIGGQYHGPSSPITFLERAWKRLRENHASSMPKTLDKEMSADQPILVTDNGHELRLSDELFQMPSKSQAYELVGRYFEISTPFFQFLHRATVTSSIESLYQRGDGQQTTADAISQSQVTLLLMIFAVATFDQTSYHYLTDISKFSEQFLEAAQRRLQREGGAPTLDSVQARLVECLYLLSTRHANEVYSKFGTTVALIITLGLHRRKRSGGYRSEIGAVEHECRKRAFWVAYVLDRYLSVMGGRPRTLQDFDTDQDFPARVHDDELTFEGIKPRSGYFDCDMDAPIMHIKLARISAQSSAQVYPLRRITQDERLLQAQRIAAHLSAWKGELPPFLGIIPASSLIPKFQRQSIILRLAHAHAAIHANRPFLLSNFANASNPPQLSPKGVDYISECVSAARSVVEILEHFDGNGIPFHSWWFTQYVSFCAVAVIYIYTIQQHQMLVSTPTAIISEDTSFRPSFLVSCRERDWFAVAESCQQRLAAAARENSPGKRYAIVLEELRQETCRHRSTPRLVCGELDIVSRRVEQSLRQPAMQDGWMGETDTDFTHIFDDLGAIDWVAHLYHQQEEHLLDAQRDVDGTNS
ncbi:uncharacterized protein PV07_06415 [Cladophialophora immunda]|uniref:Zn(2)-C6 fungal-type domain-containing protein n=1 Tax=Cladophialophora immunda TaxID=569365 RepID=A0A0D1ZFJ7_9EURO|nr:uncharacterized protein PV07_06415 [Cladophialophora immunda]KIW26596.1 hypothetical protein PV07_06415 [Cladophialophora immunda]